MYERQTDNQRQKVCALICEGVNASEALKTKKSTFILRKNTNKEV